PPPPGGPLTRPAAAHSSKAWRAVLARPTASTRSGAPPASAVRQASRPRSTLERVQWVISTPAPSLASLPAMPTKTQRASPRATARFSAWPVKSPTSTKQTWSSAGYRRMAACSVRPPVDSTTVSMPSAAITSTACSTLARQAAVEKGRRRRVLPRREMPPTMPSRGLVVLPAIRSPPGTLTTTRTPLAARPTTSATAAANWRRGPGCEGGRADLRAAPGGGDAADPLAAVDAHARLGLQRHQGGQMGAVGHVGVVAGVLDHHRPGHPATDPPARPV